MRHNLYLYQNTSDIVEFYIFLTSMNVTLYSYNGVPVDLSNYQINGRELFYITNPQKINSQKNKIFIGEDEDHIEISTQYQTGYLLQAGGIFLEIKKENTYLKDLFASIKKYIKINYSLSDNKHYYVGPNILDDWLNGKIEFPDLFKRKEIMTDSDNISLEELFDYIKNRGYVIKENEKDIRDNSGLSLSADCYIICMPEAELKTSIMGRQLHFLAGSDCIFLWIKKRQKRLEYSFQLDERLDNENHEGTRRLFNIIKNYVQGC